MLSKEKQHFSIFLVIGTFLLFGCAGSGYVPLTSAPTVDHELNRQISISEHLISERRHIFFYQGEQEITQSRRKVYPSAPIPSEPLIFYKKAKKRPNKRSHYSISGKPANGKAKRKKR